MLGKQVATRMCLQARMHSDCAPAHNQHPQGAKRTSDGAAPRQSDMGNMQVRARAVRCGSLMRCEALGYEALGRTDALKQVVGQRRRVGEVAHGARWGPCAVCPGRWW